MLPNGRLAVAADPFIPYGFVIVSCAALFSTGSAINATLFGAGYFAKGMISSDLLPDQVGGSSAEGLPSRTVLGIGVITAAFATYGSLNAITSFASIAFIVVFGGVCLLAVRDRHRAGAHAAIPVVGVVGAAAFFVLIFWHLYRAEPEIFVAVLLIAVAVVAVELLYFKRSTIEEELEEAEAEMKGAVPGGDLEQE